jgi:hypothetical protein
MQMAFYDSLAEWTDADGAAYQLAIELGIIGSNTSFVESKWIFWTDNPLGNGLHAALLALVDAGVLETRDDEAFRWKPSFTVQ